MDAYLPYLDRDEEQDNLLSNHCLLSLRYPRWTLFLVLTFSYLSVRIRHAVAAHSGTCPFPIALSLSILAATPSATLGITGSNCHQLDLPNELELVGHSPCEFSLLLVSRLSHLLLCLGFSTFEFFSLMPCDCCSHHLILSCWVCESCPRHLATIQILSL